jgi:putative spermidine/putrescine transport system ATP-binding protein
MLARTAHALSLDRVTKRFGGVVAVDDVSLAVGAGEFLTLLGPSGSGKTTLLMMIAGFIAPTAGDILDDARVITRLAPEKRRFGMVFQGYALFPHMTVAENIAFPLKVQRTPRAGVEARVRAMLDLVQLAGLADRLPRQLSGGQQQRVALARALVFQPHLVLLDEPLSALDKKLRAELQRELRDLHRRVGATFISVTHDQEEALSMSTRIAVMRDGRVIQHGAPAELYERPATRFVADFFGTTNFLPVTVGERRADGFAYDLGGRTFEHCDAEPLAAGSAVLLSIRPDRIALSVPDAASGPHLAATVRSVTYLGSQLSVELDAGALGRFTVTRPAGAAGAALEPGAAVVLSWSPTATVRVAVD